MFEWSETGGDDGATIVDFGTFLRRLRIERKLSQRELAERANMSVEAISALERGFRKRPQAGTIDLLGAALELDRDRMRALRDVARSAPRAFARKTVSAPAPGVVPNNLPSNPTSFVGRKAEIAEIAEAVGSHRLVTLVGSGGIGKTRTSLQVGAHLLDASGDGVWFVELAPLTTGDYVATTIAQAMRLSLVPGPDPLDDLLHALAHRTCLLVLDNCEHVIDAAARAVAAIVRTCPGVRVLASSRQPLGISGEAVYRMPSLLLPRQPSTEGRTLTAAEALASPAVALFADRASEVESSFALTDDNAATVATICRRLDGIPLAIELAAARSTIFTPSELLGRLDERFHLLAGGKRDVLPRQQTLRALIDWSYELLSDAERMMFRALGMFAGSFALEAAAVVTPALDEFEAIDVFAALTDKSLVLADDSGESKRFRLLETTRAYAREKLDEAAELAPVARLHLEYLRDLFTASVARRERTGNGAAHEELFAAELDDVRIAADYALGGEDVCAGAEMLAAINGISWTHIGHGSEGLARLQDFREALGDREPALVARLCAWIAVLARELGRRDLAGEASATAVTCARAAGDPTLLATALARHANTMVSLERLDEAHAALDEAERFASPSAMQERRILEARANLQRLSGNVDDAVRTWETVREQLRAIGDAGDERVAAVCLSECEFQRGNAARAIELIEELLPAARGAPDWGLYARALCDLAAYRIATGAHERAKACVHEATRLAAERDRTSPLVVTGLETLALLHARNGDGVRAARIARYTMAADRAVGFRRDYVAASIYDELVRALAGTATERAETGERRFTIDDAVTAALS